MRTAFDYRRRADHRTYVLKVMLNLVMFALGAFSVSAVTPNIAFNYDRGYRNLLLEIANECDVRAYDHAILKASRIHELIDLAKAIRVDGRRLLTGASYGGNSIPTSNVVKSSDFLLIHGNGVREPSRIAEMVRQTRRVVGYRNMPILFNEDDHFDFDKPDNNMMAAIGEYASWGYFDPGESNYSDGYQCPPVNWGINTRRKRAFFALAKEVTGS